MTVKLVPFDTDKKFLQTIATELQEFIDQESIKKYSCTIRDERWYTKNS
jgi:hypothetical protein